MLRRVTGSAWAPLEFPPIGRPGSSCSGVFPPWEALVQLQHSLVIGVFIFRGLNLYQTRFSVYMGTPSLLFTVCLFKDREWHRALERSLVGVGVAGEGGQYLGSHLRGPPCWPSIGWERSVCPAGVWGAE